MIEGRYTRQLLIIYW